MNDHTSRRTSLRPIDLEVCARCGAVWTKDGSRALPAGRGALTCGDAYDEPCRTYSQQGFWPTANDIEFVTDEHHFLVGPLTCTCPDAADECEAHEHLVTATDQPEGDTRE